MQTACKKIGVSDSRGRVGDVVVDGPALEEWRVVRPLDGRDDERVLQHVVVRGRVHLGWMGAIAIWNEKAFQTTITDFCWIPLLYTVGRPVIL